MPTIQAYVKPCAACGGEFETVNRRDRLCPDCRLDRWLARYERCKEMVRIRYRSPSLGRR